MSQKNKTVELGDKVKDKISGVVGVVVSKCQYLDKRDDQICVRKTPTKKEVSWGEGWFTESELIIVKKSAFKKV